MKVYIKKYSETMRNWGVWLAGGDLSEPELICVCAYKRGAQVVLEMAQELLKLKGLAA